MAITGFWSYVHADDEAEGGRIARLARDVVTQYEMITGEAIDLFLDRDSIEWGDEWRAAVDASLSSIAFFIPVLTPRYFQSAECRRELNFFARRVTNLGIHDLLLPILYVDVHSLHEDAPSDEAVAIVRPFHRVDWRELRFTSPDSQDYRQEVSRLAERLVEANVAAERSEVMVSPATTEPGSDGDGLGPLDLMVRAEEAMSNWVNNLLAITGEIRSIGEIVAVAGEDMTRSSQQGGNLAARQVIVRRLARDLEEPTQQIYMLGNEFASCLHEVDEGMRIIFEQVPREVEMGQSSREDVCGFYDSVRTFISAAEEGFGGLSGMIENIAPAEGLSRDLRPLLRKLRQGLTLMLEGRKVMTQWVQLMDSSGLECGETSAD